MFAYCIISGGEELNKNTGHDGFNQWNSISLDLPSPRTEVLIEIDEIESREAIRIKQYKYINGWYSSIN